MAMAGGGGSEAPATLRAPRLVRRGAHAAGVDDGHEDRVAQFRRGVGHRQLSGVRRALPGCPSGDRVRAPRRHGGVRHRGPTGRGRGAAELGAARLAGCSAAVRSSWGTLVGQSVVSDILSTLSSAWPPARSSTWSSSSFVARRIAPKELTTWCIDTRARTRLRLRRGSSSSHARAGASRAAPHRPTQGRRQARLDTHSEGSLPRPSNTLVLLNRRVHPHVPARAPVSLAASGGRPLPTRRRPHPILTDLRSKPPAPASTQSHRTIADRCLVDRLQRQPLEAHAPQRTPPLIQEVPPDPPRGLHGTDPVACPASTSGPGRPL